MYPEKIINQMSLFLLISTISESSSSTSAPSTTVRERNEYVTSPVTLTSLTTTITGKNPTHINKYTIKPIVLPTAPTRPHGPTKPAALIIPTKITLANNEIGELDKKITLALRIPEADFDKIEETFKNKKTDLENQLLATFNASGVKGLKGVEIIRFRCGSIIIDYNLIFALKTFLGQNGNSIKTLKTIENALVNQNTSLNITVNGTTFATDKKYSASQLAAVKSSLTDPCILYDDVDICEFRTQSRDFSCVPETKGIRCKPKCEGQDCSGHGQCIVRFPKYIAVCICTGEHTLIWSTTYTGHTCSEPNQTLTQNGINIIIITIVVGLLLLVAVALIATWVVLRLKTIALKKKCAESQETQQDIDNQPRSSDETQESHYMKPYCNDENTGYGPDIEENFYTELQVGTDDIDPSTIYSTIGPIVHTRSGGPHHSGRNLRFT